MDCSIQLLNGINWLYYDMIIIIEVLLKWQSIYLWSHMFSCILGMCMIAFANLFFPISSLDLGN